MRPQQAESGLGYSIAMMVLGMHILGYTGLLVVVYGGFLEEFLQRGLWNPHVVSLSSEPWVLFPEVLRIFPDIPASDLAGIVLSAMAHAPGTWLTGAFIVVLVGIGLFKRQ